MLQAHTAMLAKGRLTRHPHGGVQLPQHGHGSGRRQRGRGARTVPLLERDLGQRPEGRREAADGGDQNRIALLAQFLALGKLEAGAPADAALAEIEAALAEQRGTTSATPTSSTPTFRCAPPPPGRARSPMPTPGSSHSTRTLHYYAQAVAALRGPRRGLRDRSDVVAEGAARPGDCFGPRGREPCRQRAAATASALHAAAGGVDRRPAGRDRRRPLRGAEPLVQRLGSLRSRHAGHRRRRRRPDERLQITGDDEIATTAQWADKFPHCIATIPSCHDHRSPAGSTRSPPT